MGSGDPHKVNDKKAYRCGVVNGLRALCPEGFVSVELAYQLFSRLRSDIFVRPLNNYLFFHVKVIIPFPRLLLNQNIKNPGPQSAQSKM